MDWIVIGKFLLKSLAYITLTIIVICGILVYLYGSGIPFLEGDTNIKTGDGFHFEIGMNKSEVFDVIKNKYNKEDYYLSVLWKKSSIDSPNLEEYVDKSSHYTVNSPYSEWKAPIREIPELLRPLILMPHWKIDMPAVWVNYIYLEFEKDKLVVIRKSKWVFERA
jgi:hypothetical protein